MVTTKAVTVVPGVSHAGRHLCRSRLARFIVRWGTRVPAADVDVQSGGLRVALAVLPPDPQTGVITKEEANLSVIGSAGGEVPTEGRGLPQDVAGVCRRCCFPVQAPRTSCGNRFEHPPTTVNVGRELKKLYSRDPAEGGAAVQSRTSASSTVRPIRVIHNAREGALWREEGPTSRRSRVLESTTCIRFVVWLRRAFAGCGRRRRRPTC